MPVWLRIDADPRFSGEGVTIAFLDSGFFPHPDLIKPVNRIIRIVDVTPDSFPPGYFRQPHWESWHGTMSAVIAAGSGVRSRGLYRGVAFNSRILGIKVMEAQRKRVTSEDIAAGLRWVIDHRHEFRIRVLNITVSADEPEYLAKSGVDQLVEEAVQSGISVVVASGNRPGDPLLPPASAPSAITVGGYDDGDSLSEHLRLPYPSSYGVTLDGYEKPNLVAPAHRIPGPLLPGTDQNREAKLLFDLLRARDGRAWEFFRKHRKDLAVLRGKITAGNLKSRAWRRIGQAKFIAPNQKSMEGTSIAASIVSSVVAQMLEANPLLTPQRVKQILLKTASPLDRVERLRQGHGALNARRAVERALLERFDTEQPGAARTGGYAVFRYVNPDAGSVSLAGDFNGWDPGRTPFHEVGNGRWSCLIPLPSSGCVRYKIIVDGQKWIPDPANDRMEPDGFGGWNSVVEETGSS
jgi:serine protease AprX